MRKKPEILQRRIITQSRLFNIEAVDLAFSNGNKVTFERLVPRNKGAVMVAPILGDQLLLVREYANGVERYELGFPKGIIDDDEDLLQAANREMREEVGYAANKLTFLRYMTGSSGYLSSNMALILAEDLYAAPLPGDEPEPLEVVSWPLAQLESLLDEPDFTEARSIAAIFLIKQRLQGQ